MATPKLVKSKFVEELVVVESMEYPAPLVVVASLGNLDMEDEVEEEEAVSDRNWRSLTTFRSRPPLSLLVNLTTSLRALRNFSSFMMCS